MSKKIQEKEVLADGSSLLFKGLGEVLHDSMMPYAEHVILDRALPRVEDGLKPVQRRILYTMHELGLSPDKPYLKSARIVGDCMGKYHPHGDSSVYLAMVRMAQDFSMSAPLIDGQGNFGSNDGDSPAAMRYTEARMTSLSTELLRDLQKDTVKFSRNYDDSRKEPDMLPGRFPNLLVNGASGIAVGLATNIPPHNLSEAIDGVIAYLNNGSIGLADMMKIIKGPDFPTGGYIVANELVQAYETGRGRIKLRAKVHIERDKNDKYNIIVSELPYQVVKSKLLQDVLELREAKKEQLAHISDIVDESDKEGMRAVIKVKKDGDPAAILDVLYKHTDLSITYGVNMVAIAGGKPKQMGLLEIISYYAKYQLEVLTRRAEFDLMQAREREHIVSGLIIAVNNIDEIIAIIRGAQNRADAAMKLRKRFDLSERQAEAILEIKLARLTKLEVISLENELKELAALIKSLKAVLGDKRLLIETLKTELIEIKKKYKTPRRSVIVEREEDAAATSDDDETPVEECVVALTSDNRVKRVSKKNFNMSSRKITPSAELESAVISQFPVMTDEAVYFFTDKGNCLRCAAADIPECKYKDTGAAFGSFAAGVLPGERAVGVISASGKGEKSGEASDKNGKPREISGKNDDNRENGGRNNDNNRENANIGSNGNGSEKGNNGKNGNNRESVNNGKNDDNRENVNNGKSDNNRENGGADLIFITRTGFVKRTGFAEYGLNKPYFQAMKLKEGDSLIYVGERLKDGNILEITKKGMALAFPSDENLPVQGRISAGVTGIKLAAGDGVVYAGQVSEEGEIIIVTDAGYMKKVLCCHFEPSGRNLKGVKAIEFGAANGKEVVFASYVTNPYDLAAVTDGGVFTVNSEDIEIQSRQGKGKQPKELKGAALRAVYRDVN